MLIFFFKNNIYVPENVLLGISILQDYIKAKKFEMLSITKVELNLPDIYKKIGVSLLFFMKKCKD